MVDIQWLFFVKFVPETNGDIDNIISITRPKLNVSVEMHEELPCVSQVNLWEGLLFALGINCNSVRKEIFHPFSQCGRGKNLYRIRVEAPEIQEQLIFGASIILIIPAFGDMSVEDITVTDIQRVLNDMGDVSKDTKKKAMLVLRMILAQAVEEGYVIQNVAKSKRIRITGKAAKETEPYSVEQMQYLVAHIPDLQNPIDRAYLALAALHPLRPEEVFGLQFGDIDRQEFKIRIQRAVTYPDRNQPLLKATKTESSVRTIDLAPQVIQYLPDGDACEFILGGKDPMSYQQIRRMRARIQKQTGFDEPIVPRRFRTTVLTDLYDATKDIKQTQAAAGHTTADMTLKHYVKGRQQSSNSAIPIANRYGLTS